MTNTEVAIQIDDTPISGELTKTVNARNLYEQLAVRKDFSAWAKDQIKRAGLEEGTDFAKLTQKGELSATGQTTIEYHLTVGAAKHIAMMSGSALGKQVRNYFIQIEKDHLKLLNEKAALTLAATDKYSGIGQALITAVRNQEYDSAKELEDMLDKLDFGPAARTEGVHESVIRRRIALHTAATVRLEHIARGEHAHNDSVREVLKLAQSTVQAEDAHARLESQRRQDALIKQSYHQLLANDLQEKHTGGALMVKSKPRKRAPRASK